MAGPDGFLYEGFDKYGANDAPNLTTNLLMGEWNTVGVNSARFTIIGPLSGDGTGQALRFDIDGSFTGSGLSLTKYLDDNYTRVCGGLTYKFSATTINRTTKFGIVFGDGATGQFAVILNQDGTFSLVRGNDDGTVLFTSTDAPSLGTTNCLEWDVTCHGTTGKATFYLNGVETSIAGLTDLDLTSTANDYFNRVWFAVDHSGGVNTGGDYKLDVDHFFCHFYLDPDNPDAGCLLTNPVIDTDFPAQDIEVDFTPITTTIGTRTRYGTSVASPAANSLILRKFDAVGNGTLTKMRIIANATNATAKFKGVIYADDGTGTAPAALIDSGTEVEGCTSGQPVESTMNNVALVDGVTYWIGFLMNTSLSMQLSDTGATGYRAASTYTSGAPDPAPTMTTGQGSWFIYGIVAPEQNWSQLTVTPQSTLSYNSGDTAGEQDLFSFGPLGINPSQIHGIAIKANLRRTDAGARTMKVLAVRDEIETASDESAPSTTGTWLALYTAEDPSTGEAWTASGVGSLQGGYRIES